MERFKLSSLFVFINLVYLVSSSYKPSVIIVGAGPAGVAAASKLLENDYLNITVLEAEARIGGRIHSVKFGDAYVDLGAEWCHGEKDNVVYDLVKDLKILGHTETPQKIYHSSGLDIDDEFGSELVDFMESIYVPDGNRDYDEGKTVGDYCIEKYNKTIHEAYQNDSKKLKIAKHAMDTFHHYVLGSEGSFSWFDPSAKSDYRDCEGDLNLNWNGLGYKTILDVLLRRFPNATTALPFDNKVLLNKEVSKVYWNQRAERNGITVKCSDGTRYVADNIIFTPSIGVLKDKHKGMFFPPLPKSKSEAIENIGFGAVMKVVMHFPTAWWGAENVSGINFIWSNEDIYAASKEFPQGTQKDGRSWITHLFCIVKVEKNENVLVAWFTGDAVPVIELLSDQEIIDGIEYVLKKFLSNKFDNIVLPDRIIHSTWYSNPHFRGSYSFQTIQARQKEVTSEIELAKPLMSLNNRPIVQFAGEASHPHYYSTVHGAIETGFREANRIINLLK